MLCHPISAAETLTMACGGGTLELTLEEYVTGVVLGEVPYTFGEEAIKAQAVAARTYYLYCKQTGARQHEGADVCDSPAHCCGFTTEADLAARFGEDYARRSVEIVRAAVEATAGEVLTYEGEPICAVWHASSPGATEASENVWQGALPYLVSVTSEEAVDLTEVTLTSAEVASLLPDWDGGRSLEWASNSSGRCGTLGIGNLTLTGTEARALFGLRSTALTARWDGDMLRLTAAGYGHGVGMSQRGADAMASRGCGYREILAHYYPGCEVG